MFSLKGFSLYPTLLFPSLFSSFYGSSSLSLLVSYSFTIISIPSCCIYQKGYGALRIFFFSHPPVDLLLFLVSILCASSTFSHATLEFWRGSCAKVTIWIAIFIKCNKFFIKSSFTPVKQGIYLTYMHNYILAHVIDSAPQCFSDCEPTGCLSYSGSSLLSPL